jgi:hypothetical protein
MIIRKLTDPIFIYFSKMYIHFYEDQKGYWSMFPSLILAFLFMLNFQIISYFILIIPRYYYVALGLFFILVFLLAYRDIKYEYVKNYRMSKKTKLVITILLVADLSIIFTCLNILRNGKFMW